MTNRDERDDRIPMTIRRRPLAAEDSTATVPPVSETYTKLFSSILRSTIWSEDNETRLVWITMLAMADRNGYVGASVPGLAAAAKVSIESAAAAIEKFLEPDKWSRSKEYDGRRIEVADRGWNLLNYDRFRDMRDEEARREYERERKRRLRAKDVPDGPAMSRDVPTGTHSSAQAEAQAEAQAAPEEQSTERAASAPLAGRKRPAITRPGDVPIDVWEAWLGVRKDKRAGPVTTVALAGVQREAAKAGVTLEAAIRECAERSWVGFRADWHERDKGKFGGNGRKDSTIIPKVIPAGFYKNADGTDADPVQSF